MDAIWSNVAGAAVFAGLGVLLFVVAFVILDLLTPGLIMPFFKTGPFAWDGLIAYWIPAFVFGGWFYFMAYHMIKAINRQTPEG